MKEDRIDIQILGDGTIRFETDPISGANHVSAEQFLKEIERLTAGQVTKKRRQKVGQVHQHVHGHVHQH